MLPNDDLARWGEPPTDARELEVAELLATGQVGGLPYDLADVCRRIEEMMTTVAASSGVLEDVTPPSPRLRLSVSRLVLGARRPIASTHAAPCVVRDMRRVPDDPDRVTLRTGDRVRIEAVCAQAGHLLVFNVGPGGQVNLLYPSRPGETGAIRGDEAIGIGEVEMTPPAGRERLYAVWSRSPISTPGARLRDMKLVEETLTSLRSEDWHAVLLELDHQG